MTTQEGAADGTGEAAYAEDDVCEQHRATIDAPVGHSSQTWLCQWDDPQAEVSNFELLDFSLYLDCAILVLDFPRSDWIVLPDEPPLGNARANSRQSTDSRSSSAIGHTPE